MISRPLLAAALTLAFSVPAHADESPANRANLGEALRQFLAQRGDICLAKYDWPIDVSARDVAKRTRDAQQMPVLEREGLVRSREGYVVYRTDENEESVPTRRFELTELGRQFYKSRDTVSSAHGSAGAVHHADLCAGHLELDSIVSITEPLNPADGLRRATASYLYRFKPEAWASKAPVLAVFPMLDMLIRNQGRMPMTQNFHLEGARWVADTQLE